jgi:hypothetical protein
LQVVASHWVKQEFQHFGQGSNLGGGVEVIKLPVSI